MLKLCIYGYLNRVQSSHRLERECQRNVEVMWLTGCLAPDFKTIADFRRDNGPAIGKVCREFIVVCGRAGLLAATTVAIDGSKFKAVNSRDRGQLIFIAVILGRLAAARRLKPPQSLITGYRIGLCPNGAQPAFRPYPSLHLKHAADRRGDYQQQQADR